VESKEERPVRFYSQGVDLAGEKGVGKALTYAEKYFFMKYFHVPTGKDDPDSDGRTKSGEKKQTGTQAAKESADYLRKALTQMLHELAAGDAEKMKTALMVYTKSKDGSFAGYGDVNDIPDKALPLAYACAKNTYEKRIGPFVYKEGSY